MTRQTEVDSLSVREFAPDDLPGVLELLTAALDAGPGGDRTQEFFRWKHLENPFGRSVMLLAESDGRLVGLRAFMRWRFRVANGRTVRAVRAVDTATHPEYQGRGIFSMLTKRAIAGMRGDVDLIFNTPNEKSLPGYLKMGWKIVGKVPVQVRPRRPLHFALGLRSLRGVDEPARRRPVARCETAAEALADREAIADLLARARVSDERLRTDDDVEYLGWRYASAPLLDYRAVREVGPHGSLRGLALFRVRPRGRLWECTVGEVFAEAGDRATAARLLSRVGKASGVDHLAVAFPQGSAQAHAATRRGFVRAPGGMTMVVNPLDGATSPDPLQPSSWAVRLGDLEVF